MNEEYSRLIVDGRLSVYDSIVEGRPFAKMATGVINDSLHFGERAARDCSLDMSFFSSGVKFDITDNPSLDFAVLRATAATEALGKMFTGDMAGVVELLVHSGIQFGYAVERQKIASASPAIAEMFDAIVDNMKLTDNKVIPDAPTMALFEALSSFKDRELALHYANRLLKEERLRVNHRLPAVKDFMSDFSRLLM